MHCRKSCQLCGKLDYETRGLRPLHTWKMDFFCSFRNMYVVYYCMSACNENRIFVINSKSAPDEADSTGCIGQLMNSPHKAWTALFKFISKYHSSFHRSIKFSHNYKYTYFMISVKGLTDSGALLKPYGGCVQLQTNSKYRHYLDHL